MKKTILLIIVVIFVFSLFAVDHQGAASRAKADGTETYIVLYKQPSVPARAAEVIAAAGGTLVYQYDPIGVVLTQSSSPDFRDRLMLDKKIENVSSTTGFGIQMNDQIQVVDTSEWTADSNWGDPLSAYQWDMVQIHVPEAYEITGGSPDVVVGDIDTGIDYTHPDLAANVDFAGSVSCIGGIPDQDPAAWMDEFGHGTHTAGTIAAAANDYGIVGVAPNVKVAAIKVVEPFGYIFPEAVICAFMWAGSHHMEVTNNSYFADPWLFNCRNDPEQHAIWKAEQRAIKYAMNQGVVVVAAMTNYNMDLSKRNIDPISPDTDPYPPPREVTNACVVIPAEIPGVIGVSADGYFLQKAYYSSYGIGVTQLTAPGGDDLQDPGDGTYGLVLSTVPGGYGLGGGTSMATPHVAGVAALILSQYGPMPQGTIQAMLNQTAVPIPCPPNPFDPTGDGNWIAYCQGGEYNGFYGHGQVDALNAVTHAP
jgi:lantibiotic leader peptide-processing serine protease